jgi:hypothetical protein
MQQVCDREDAITNTRDARATRNFIPKTFSPFFKKILTFFRVFH